MIKDHVHDVLAVSRAFAGLPLAKQATLLVIVRYGLDVLCEMPDGWRRSRVAFATRLHRAPAGRVRGPAHAPSRRTRSTSARTQPAHAPLPAPAPSWRTRPAGARAQPAHAPSRRTRLCRRTRPAGARAQPAHAPSRRTRPCRRTRPAGARAQPAHARSRRTRPAGAHFARCSTSTPSCALNSSGQLDFIASSPTHPQRSAAPRRSGLATASLLEQAGARSTAGSR
jgi:hypothetical protein